MITLLTGFPDSVLAVECKGHVTRENYEDVLMPAAMRALEQHAKVRVYYEVAPDFAGIDAGAIWDDFRIGVGHLSRWERIAVVTDVACPPGGKRVPVSDAGSGARISPKRDRGRTALDRCRHRLTNHRNSGNAGT